MNKKLLSSSDIAELLGVSKGFAYKLMSSGAIPTIKIGKKTLRVKQEELDNYLQKISEDCSKLEN